MHTQTHGYKYSIEVFIQTEAISISLLISLTPHFCVCTFPILWDASRFLERRQCFVYLHIFGRHNVVAWAVLAWYITFTMSPWALINECARWTNRVKVHMAASRAFHPAFIDKDMMDFHNRFRRIMWHGGCDGLSSLIY